MLLPTGNGPKKIRESVEIGEHERFVGYGSKRRSLGASYHRPSDVERGGELVLTGHNELLREFESTAQIVDEVFEFFDHRLVHPTRS